MLVRYPKILPHATGLLLLCSLLTACGVRAYTFEDFPRPVEKRNVYPWRVGVVAEKQFTPYQVKYRYWSSTNFMWPLKGLPDTLVRTLRPYFRSVELVPTGQDTSGDHYDLIARMSVDRIHFNGAKTTVSDDTVDLTMTFAIDWPNGAEVFKTTV